MDPRPSAAADADEAAEASAGADEDGDRLTTDRNDPREGEERRIRRRFLRLCFNYLNLTSSKLLRVRRRGWTRSVFGFRFRRAEWLRGSSALTDPPPPGPCLPRGSNRVNRDSD
eukprot:8680-Pelagococcus_subviridis.AAC.1